MREKNITLFELIGKSFIYYWFILLTVTTVGFIFGVGISNFHSYISLVLLAAILQYLYEDINLTIKTMIGLLLLIMISILLSLQIWDFSYDGRTYHFRAIQALSEGWNPFYLPNLGSFEGFIHDTWAESYPKANWIFVANNLQLFNNIDASKYINYTLLISSGFIINSFLTKDIKSQFIRFLFIFPMLINPVAIGQINTLYLDGNLYFLIIIFTITLIKYHDMKNKENLLFLTALTIILLNMKFTAIVFLVVGFLLFLLLEYKKSKSIDLKLIKKIVILFLLGIGLFGYSPYIHNIHYHGHPLYPALGKHQKNVLLSQTDNDFLKLNRFQKFFYSINAKPTMGKEPMPEITNPVKIIFDINNYDMNCFDTRINGFGPLYSVTILLTLLGLLYSLYRKKRINKYFTISIMLILMSFSIPPTWWARLVPMMWAVPIFFSLYFYTKNDKFLKFLSIVIIVILMLNAIRVDANRLEYEWDRTLKEHQVMDKMVGKHIYIASYLRMSRSGKRTILHKLNMYNIDFERIKYSNCKKVDVFYDAEICIKKSTF